MCAVLGFVGGSDSTEIFQGLCVVSEASKTSPSVTDLLRRVQDAQVFLRMAAIELRRIAEQAPDTAIELLHMAQQVEAEAEDLARGPQAGPDPAVRVVP